MPEEVEIETKELQETIEEMREERAEREAEERRSAWLRWISLSTALLAVVAAIAALQSGSLVNEALDAKNDAVLDQAKASDEWAYYQAKGLKRNGAEQTADVLSASPAQRTLTAKWEQEAKRYKSEQAEEMRKAQELEQERDVKTKEAKELMERHHIFAYCVTFTQVAIALSAIAALTKRKPVWYVSLLVGVAGLLYFAGGFLQTANKGTETAPTPGVESQAPASKKKGAPLPTGKE